MAGLRRQVGFRERWIWYHIAAFALIVVLVISLDPLGQILGLNMDSVLIGMSIAIGAGIMEWAMLRRYGIGFSWVGYTLLGFMLSFFLADIANMYFQLKSTEGLSAIPVAFGACLAGSFQYAFILRKYNGAGKAWIALYPLGWTVAYFSSMSVSIVPRLPVKGIASLPLALALIFSGAFLLAWITSGYLKALFANTAEIPDADLGKDLI